MIIFMKFLAPFVWTFLSSWSFVYFGFMCVGGLAFPVVLFLFVLKIEGTHEVEWEGMWEGPGRS